VNTDPLPYVRVTQDAVFIDGELLPGYIKSHGVTVTPGFATDTNILTVQFVVGKVDMDDPTMGPL